MESLKLLGKLLRFFRYLRKFPSARRGFFLILDSILLSLSIYFSFWLRFDGYPHEWMSYASIMGILVLLTISTKIPVYWFFRLYDISWSFASLRDALQIVVANGVASTAFYSMYDFGARSLNLLSLPRSVIIIDFLLSTFLIGLIRFSKRVGVYTFRTFYSFGGKKENQRTKNVLVIGAGNAGEQLVRSLLKDSKQFRLVGIIDDNPVKWNTYLHGVKVIGGRDKIKTAVEQYDVDVIIIAIPSASGSDVKEFVNLSREAGVTEIKILPSMAELVNGTVSVRDVRDVSVEDLLGRDQVEIEMKEVEKFVKGKVVLVTGASGSIGEELCRQIAKFDPARVVLFELDETRLFNTHRTLKRRYPKVEFVPVLADVRDKEKTFCVLHTYKPDVVFHAAAYKHVPMMEAFPEEAVKTNIIGTYNIGLASIETGVKKFIFISTDKAVNPTSVMGASKRIGEMLIIGFNEKSGTQFTAVRFGNVLGSRGSVIPIFKEQIRHGGPVTVTHPDMKRYFMTIPEAVLLVLQAGAMGVGGEVFVLDMGEPIRIVDVARELISLMGYKPDEDIPIAFTGVRPGEKLFEELLTAEEGTEATEHYKIFRARLSGVMPSEKLFDRIMYLNKLAREIKRDEIIHIMMEIVPSYKPNRDLKFSTIHNPRNAENSSNRNDNSYAASLKIHP